MRVLPIGGYLWPALKHGPWFCSPPSLGWSVFLTNGIAGVAVFFFGIPFCLFLAGCFLISLPFQCPPFLPLPPPPPGTPSALGHTGGASLSPPSSSPPWHLQSHCLGCRAFLPRSSRCCSVHLQLALDFPSSWLLGLWWPRLFGLAIFPPCQGFLPVLMLVLVGMPPVRAWSDPVLSPPTFPTDRELSCQSLYSSPFGS